MTTKFKAIYYLNGYVDTTKLQSGIYHSARPSLLSENQTMDSIIQAAEQIGYSAEYIHNLKQCKLVDVEVAMKPEIDEIENECHAYTQKGEVFIATDTDFLEAGFIEDEGVYVFAKSIVDRAIITQRHGWYSEKWTYYLGTLAFNFKTAEQFKTIHQLYLLQE